MIAKSTTWLGCRIRRCNCETPCAKTRQEARKTPKRKGIGIGSGLGKTPAGGQEYSTPARRRRPARPEL